MDTKSITMVIIGLMVSGLILVAFVPIFTEVTATTQTFENDGYFKVDTTDEDFSFSWDYDAPTVYTINGNDMTFTNSYNLDISVVMSDSFFIRSDRNGVAVYFNGDGVGNVVADSTNQTLTVSRSGTTVTATNGNVTRTLTDDSTIYYMSETGNYVMKNSTTPAYMLEDSLIFARGYSALPGPTYTPVLIVGDIENGVQATATNESVTISNVSVNSTAVDGYIGLYSLTDVTMTGTVSGNDSTITYNYFVVPNEVTVEKAVHGDDVFNTVINIIPLLAGVGLLMAGVYYFITRK